MVNGDESSSTQHDILIDYSVRSYKSAFCITIHNINRLVYRIALSIFHNGKMLRTGGTGGLSIRAVLAACFPLGLLAQSAGLLQPLQQLFFELLACCLIPCFPLFFLQGAAISSSITLGLSYCCCTAAGSLCNACLGSTAEGTTGRKRSVLLLSLAIALALWFQYAVGPAIVSQKGWIWSTYRWMPGVGKIVYHAWFDGCSQYENDKAMLEICAGNAGVFRPMAIVTWFFAISAVATKVQPSLNRQVWPAKYAMVFFAIALSVFLHSAPLFTGFFLWSARLGAMIFCFLQQLILIDVAYNWNEDWVDRAE